MLSYTNVFYDVAVVQFSTIAKSAGLIGGPRRFPWYNFYAVIAYPTPPSKQFTQANKILRGQVHVFKFVP